MSENKQAYISHVHLKGYKSIRDMEIDLLPGLNIIIGPNGSGKTNFLEFLDYSNSFSVLTKSPPKQDFYSHIEVSLAEGDKIDTFYIGSYKMKTKKNLQFVIHILGKINNNKIYIDHELIFSNIQEVPEIHKGNIKNEEDNIDIGIPNYLTFTNPLHLLLNQGIKIDIIGNLYEMDENDEAIGEPFSLLIIESPHNVSGIENLLQESFGNLNKQEINKSIKKNFNLHEKFKIDLAKYTSIQDLKLDLEIAREFDSNSIDNLFFQFYVNEKWLYWNQLSDGTKRLFYILVSTFFTESNRPVFLEEPELGIHPDQLKKLMQFLKEQAKEKQIIITTHSPQVLNILSENELDHIITTRYDAEKGTTMHHLTEEQKQVAHNYIEEGLSLGDAWVYSTQFEQAIEEEEIG